MAETGVEIVEKDGVFYLSGVLNEYADFATLLMQEPPLKINLRGVSRFNSIGIRNLLKLLTDWGSKPFSYFEVPSQFVDQVNMIPSLLGPQRSGEIKSLFVPYECTQCDYEAEILCKIEEFAAVKKGGGLASRTCPKCAGKMTVLTDSYFVFLQR